MMNYRILILLGLSCLLTFAGIGQPKIGEKVPDIVLKDLNGKIEKLSAHKGKIVLIDFWASWCGPCRRSNKDLAKLYIRYKDKGFEIFGVSIDDEPEAWRKAVFADKILWKQVNEPGGWDAPVAVQWNLQQIPASFLIDKDGKLIALDPGKNDIESELKKRL